MGAAKAPVPWLFWGIETPRDWCSATCSPTERERRNRPIDGGDCVFFGPPGLPKRVLGGDRPVRGDGGDGGGGDDDDEKKGFQWFLNLKEFFFKTRLKGIRPVVSNF